MREQLVQVLRLPVLPLASAKAPVRADTAPGLGLAFPACPACAHKVIRRPAADTADGAADTPQQRPAVWACRNCHAEVHDAGIVWTYRITSSLAGARGAAGVTACVLGAAAEAWFGCTAAQWVGETSDALLALARHHPEASAAALLEHMRDRLAVLVGMVSGVAGEHALVDLRRTPAAAARNRAAQYHVSRIRPVGATTAACTPAKIIRLWRFAVYDALLAAQTRQPNECAESEQLLRALEADTQPLCINSELAAPCSVVELAPNSGAAAEDAAWPDGAEAALSAWAQVHGPRAEPAAPRIAVYDAADGRDAGIVATASTAMSNAGGLHDNTSQLFAFDSSVALAELLGSDDPLSVQHFEESLRDEHADSLFLDSQLSFGLFESQMSLRGAAQAAAGEADWSQPEHFALGDPPAWLLPHTPSSALLQRLDATLPTASQGSHWAASVRSAALRASQPTPTSVGRIRVEGSMPVVLAEETPAAHSHGSKRKLEFFVPETPLPAKGARRLPAGPQQPRAADTPVMRRSASSGISWVVPETPAARETPVQQASKAARNKAHERYHPLAMAGSIRLDQALLERRRRHTRELRLSRTATHAEAPGIPALALGLARSSSSTAGADDAAAGSGDA